MSDEKLLSRRRFLKTSFAFSAAALTGCGAGVFALPTQPDPVSGGVSHYLMVGDYGQSVTPTDQSAVAAAMQAYATKYKFDTDALLMLGDNFYGDMPGGVNSPRWRSQFEQMYPASSFNCPAFAMPGNHDYQIAPVTEAQTKYQSELAYAARGGSRWTMPSRYYTFKYPVADPTVTFIVLDSNMPHETAQPIPPNASYTTQTDAQRLEQLAWLEQTLAQPLTTPFLVVMAHHPLYSNGPHGDNKTLINDWGPLFKKYGVHLYLAGHDHDLQHLEFAGDPTSYFISGGGGAELTTLGTRHQGAYGNEVHGFSHLQVRPDMMILRHLDTTGGLLHKFTKTPDGTVTIVK